MIVSFSLETDPVGRFAIGSWWTSFDVRQALSGNTDEADVAEAAGYCL